jgi:hypothetical protein
MLAPSGRGAICGWLEINRRHASTAEAEALVNGQLLVTATQSISMSKGPVHCGTQKKIRAGGFFGN